MDHKTVEDYILSLPNTKLDYPFGEGVAVYKVFVAEKSSTSQASGEQGNGEKRERRTNGTVSESRKQLTQQSAASTSSATSYAGGQGGALRGDWKMFALMPESKMPVNISLKCDPQLAVILREKFETVLPGYHLNKKHWNTIILSGQLPWEEIQGLILHSYNLVTGVHSETPNFD